MRVDALALDPQAPDVLYAATGLGVFKTTNGARTWKLASTGIRIPASGLGHRLLEGFMWAIAIDPLHTSTVYAAGNGVWKSTNGGATWKRALPNGAINLGIDPRQPETVYASVMKGYGKKATRNSILKTVDGGDTWRATGPSGLHDGYFGHPIVVDRRVPGIVHAGGSRGLFASANQGRTWRKLLSSGGASGGVLAIALDPSRANDLYVGTASKGLLTSEDGGLTWSEASLDMPTVSAVAVDPTRPQTIYAGGAAIWKSTDGGAKWHRLA